jgi:hypothetical protein
MTSPPDVIVLADHSVLLAIPAIAPAVVVVGVVVYLAMRDRRRSIDGPQDENPEPSGHDESP